MPCGWDPSEPLRFRFNRWLLPTSVVPEALYMYTQGTNFGYRLYPQYDPATRTLSCSTPNIRPEGLVLELELKAADEDKYGSGLRSYEGEPLDRPIRFTFRVGQAQASSPGNSSASAAATCDAALMAFRQAGCSGVGCHSRQASPECAAAATPSAWDPGLGRCVQVPRMGLLLDAADGLRNTAINQVSHQTQIGPDIAEHAVSGVRFGAQMPIIDMGHPENSYLIYKLLIGKQLNEELASRHEPAEPVSPVAMSQRDIEASRDWFIRFGPMPPASVGYPSGVSPLQVYTTLKTWIAAGAACP